jgi:transcriptional regulator with XRE-family HTH domain
MSRLGETIKRARVGAGLSEKALGKKCGFAEKFIVEIESGARIVSDEQAQRILKTLGVKNPVSTELEVAAEPPVRLRPRPKPYVLPAEAETARDAAGAEKARAGEADAPTDLWLNALSGVVKRVPVVGEDSVVIDHVLMPVIDGKIEGANPDKALYFRCPDDSLRGFRIYAGDLLLTVPCATPVNDAVMLIQRDGLRTARKVLRTDGGAVLLQRYDREFTAERAELKDILIVGRCVKLIRPL